MYDIYDIPNAEISLRPLIAATFCIQAFFFMIRISSIRMRKQDWGLDDTSITISWALLVGWLPILILEEYYGFYRNLYTGEIWKIDQATKVFFAFEIVYALALGMTKVSIVFLYLRVFTGVMFRRVLWATQVFNALVMLSFIVGILVSCKPLEAYWAYASDVEGECPDSWDTSGIYPALNMALDLWMIALPVAQVRKLKMDNKAKIGVLAMFGLGLL